MPLQPRSPLQKGRPRSQLIDPRTRLFIGEINTVSSVHSIHSASSSPRGSPRTSPSRNDT